MRAAWIRRFDFIVMLAAAASTVQGQINTGTIRGTVVDPQNLVIAGAAVSVQNTATGGMREMQTNALGEFVFSALPQGDYALKIAAEGFRPLERRGLALSSSQVLSIGTVTLTVGSAAESITVSAEVALVQAGSAEISAQVDARQIEMTLARGRDVISLLQLMPGVASSTAVTSMGGTTGTALPSISGLRGTLGTAAIDGQVGSDNDVGIGMVGAISLDFIDEVRILANNYQAEYGRNAGANINIVSKSGTARYHGSASWFVRNNAFNANEFFNNTNGLRRPLYRFNTLTATLGGPVYIPKLNLGRSKLFFFYGHEHWRVAEPAAVRSSTMPTNLERAGDFSQTLDVGGRLVPIRDPLTGAQFPGNVIPRSRLNRYGQALLNLFPQPFLLDRTITRGSYNYQFQEVLSRPKHLDQFKVDYNISKADRLSVRFRHWYQSTVGYVPTASFSSNWPQLLMQYRKAEDAGMLNYTRILNASMVNEFVFSGRRILEGVPDMAKYPLTDVQTTTAPGLAGLPQLYPAANPLNLVPAMSFAGVPSAPTVAYDSRFPIVAGDTRESFSDNFTWTVRNHTFKAGVYYEFNLSDEGHTATCFGGCLNFGVDRNNANDSNYAFSNAAMGNFLSYEQSNREAIRGAQISMWEWFLQDSWRVTRRLTLEVGTRFSYFPPWRPQPGFPSAAYVPSRYDPNKAVRLYRPAFDAQRRRVGQDPTTGSFVPAVMIGAIVPDSGNLFNGIVEATDKSYPSGWQKNAGVQPAPRFGFAWDVFGNSKTAIRGGFGITKQTALGSNLGNNVTLVPPNVLTPRIYYGNIDTIVSQSGVYFPFTSAYGFELDYKPASVYSYSLGIQQTLPLEVVLSAAYVGNQGKHQTLYHNQNVLPYGTRFRPENADPTNPSVPLPDIFLVPYTGYGTSLPMINNSGLSNYNSLQVTAKRRYSRGFLLGLAYTWSKTMSLQDSETGLMPMYRDRSFLYGKASYDQTHILTFNVVWDLPRGSKLLTGTAARVARPILDNWQISTFTTFASGTPGGIGFSTTDNMDITGGGDGGRINVIGRASLPFGERSFNRWFDTSVLRRPAKGDWGNAPKDIFRGPGTNNWDISVFKSFPILSESRVLQFRGEFYNAFNHTQFSGVDTAARFDAAGNQVNTRLGQVTAARPPRVIQLALTFRF